MRHTLTLLFLLFCLADLSAQNKRFEKGAGKENKEKASEESAEGPDKDPSTQKKPELICDRLIYGGGLGLSFGNFTQISLAPQVGYRFDEEWVAGLGFIYNYIKINRIFDPALNQWVKPNFENIVYGPTFFGNYFPSDKIFLGAQFEYLNYDDYFYSPTQADPIILNRWSSVLFLQAGYLQPMGEKGFLQVGLRVNVLHDESSPYGRWWSPLINVYF